MLCPILTTDYSSQPLDIYQPISLITVQFPTKLLKIHQLLSAQTDWYTLIEQSVIKYKLYQNFKTRASCKWLKHPLYWQSNVDPSMYAQDLNITTTCSTAGMSNYILFFNGLQYTEKQWVLSMIYCINGCWKHYQHL